MKKETIFCDRCAKEYNPLNGEGISFSVRKSTDMDPSGNGYVTNYSHYDFCKGCVEFKMQFFIDERRDLL